MYSNRALTRLLLVLIGLSAIVSCGRKEPPTPPPLMVAAQTKDLMVKQRGSEILLSFSYPTLTPAGLALPQVEAIEIWEYERPLTLSLDEDEETQLEATATDEGDSAAPTAQVAEEGPETDAESELEGTAEGAAPSFSLFGAPPPSEEEGAGETAVEEPETVEGGVARAEPRAEAELRVDPREFQALAQLRLTLQGPELAASVLGDRVITRLPLQETPDGNTARIFAVRVLSGKKLVSAFSNLQVLIPRATPDAPQEIAIEPRQEGVEIAWQTVEEELAGHHIYRREAQVPFYGEPIYMVPPESDRYLDSGAAFDRRYIYSVTGVVAADAPVVETALSAERELDYQDRFPPPAPADPLALAEPGRVRLLWEESEAPDVAGYRVYRREGEGDFRPLNEDLVLRLEFLDTEVVSDRVYSYEIRTVDRAGNESEASEQVDVLIP
jgi:hypothetical protein